jgi:hypothetical protein
MVHHQSSARRSDRNQLGRRRGAACPCIGKRLIDREFRCCLKPLSFDPWCESLLILWRNSIAVITQIVDGIETVPAAKAGLSLAVQN